MKYVGSKNRHSKEILNIILRDRLIGQFYVEPFVGGFNMIDKVDGNRIGSDSNKYIIALFKAIQNGWVPPEYVSEDEYKECKRDMDSYPEHLVGFIGFGCSFAGKFFGGYARGNDSKGVPRNYARESCRNIIRQFTGVQGIDIRMCSYDDLEIPDNSIIYCDPPYANTVKYSVGEFDSDRFFDWCRLKSSEGHTVFVSEYNAPRDFTCVWFKEVNNTLNINTGEKRGLECLFRL
jgi:DNA adenine methylase